MAVLRLPLLVSVVDGATDQCKGSNGQPAGRDRLYGVIDLLD